MCLSVCILPSGFFFIYTDVTNKQTPRPLLIFWKIEKYHRGKEHNSYAAPYITAPYINYHFVYIFSTTAADEWLAGHVVVVVDSASLT